MKPSNPVIKIFINRRYRGWSCSDGIYCGYGETVVDAYNCWKNGKSSLERACWHDVWSTW